MGKKDSKGNKKEEPKENNIPIPLEGIELPEWIKEGSQELREKYIELTNWESTVNNHPDRYVHVTGRNGESKVYDLKGFLCNIEKGCMAIGVSKKEIDQIKIKHKEFAMMKVNTSVLTQAFNKLRIKAAGGSKELLLADEKAKILDLAGEFRTIEEIVDIIDRQYGYPSGLWEVKRVIRENQIVVDQKRADYVLRNKDFRLATETGRLEELNYLFSVIKDKFDKGNQKIEYSKELRAILEAVRKEVKGDEIKLTLDGKIDIHASIQANQNVMDMARKMPIHLIVVALVAAKANVEPTQIMSALASSFYSRFNGFNGATDDKKDMNVLYPSSIIKQYDWGQITQIAKEDRERLKPLNDTLIYSDREKQKIAEQKKMNLRDALKRQAEMAKNNREERAQRLK